jgi:hypothetical protein
MSEDAVYGGQEAVDCSGAVLLMGRIRAWVSCVKPYPTPGTGLASRRRSVITTKETAAPCCFSITRTVRENIVFAGGPWRAAQ